jgi:hypothetical protein
MRWRIYLTILVVMFGTLACSATPAVNPNGPARNQPLYPALLADSQQRRNEAAGALSQLIQEPEAANTTRTLLQPVTATVRSLPDSLRAPVYLPRVGTGAEMNEEDTRESLRRFLNQWQKLLGANPAQLSLAHQAANGDGTQVAVFEQRAFPYPLRGGFGKIEVRFANDRRLLSLTSTAIPDADKVQTALSATAPRLKSEDVPTHLSGRKIDYRDAAGAQHSFIISSVDQIINQQVVIYPLLSATRTGTLEFHLAWEVTLNNAPVQTIYYDAIQDEVIATG